MPKKQTAKNSGGSKGATKAAPTFKSKSDFVRAHPNVSAPEVVRRALAAGLEGVKEGLVYNVRAAERKKQGAAPNGVSLAVAEAPRTESPLLENQFRSVAVSLGLRRAFEILTELEAWAAGSFGAPAAQAPRRKPSAAQGSPSSAAASSDASAKSATAN